MQVYVGPDLFERISVTADLAGLLFDSGSRCVTRGSGGFRDWPGVDARKRLLVMVACVADLFGLGNVGLIVY